MSVFLLESAIFIIFSLCSMECILYLILLFIITFIICHYLLIINKQLSKSKNSLSTNILLIFINIVGYDKRTPKLWAILDITICHYSCIGEVIPHFMSSCKLTKTLGVWTINAYESLHNCISFVYHS